MSALETLTVLSAAALDLQLGQGASQGGLDRRHFFCKEVLAQSSTRTLSRILSFCFVDAFGGNRHVRHDNWEVSDTPNLFCLLREPVFHLFLCRRSRPARSGGPWLATKLAGVAKATPGEALAANIKPMLRPTTTENTPAPIWFSV